MTRSRQRSAGIKPTGMLQTTPEMCSQSPLTMQEPFLRWRDIPVSDACGKAAKQWHGLPDGEYGKLAGFSNDIWLTSSGAIKELR